MRLLDKGITIACPYIPQCCGLRVDGVFHEKHASLHEGYRENKWTEYGCMCASVQKRLEAKGDD